MKPFYALSLRTLLVSLLFLGTLFPLGLIAYSAVRLYHHQLHEAYIVLQAETSEFASYQQRQSASLEQLAVMIAELPAVREHRPAESVHILKKLVAAPSSPLIAIRLADAQGVVWASTSLASAAENVRGRRCFVGAMATGRFSSDEYTALPPEGGEQITFAYPLTNDAGRIAGAVLLTTSLSRSLEQFRNDFPQHAKSLTLTDHRGMVLFSSENISSIGMPDSSELFAGMIAHPHGSVFEYKNDLGQTLLISVRSVSLPFESTPFLFIRTTSDKGLIHHTIFEQTAYMMLSFSGLLLLVAALFWYIGKKGVLDIVDRLRAIAEKVANSNALPAPYRNYSGNELDNLVSTFDTMANTLASTIETVEKSDAALKRSEQNYQELVEKAQSIILKMDMQGKVIFINPFAEELLGFSESEIVGRSVIGTIVPETESSGRNLREMIDALIAHPEQFSRNINENITKNGDRLWISWNNHQLIDGNGVPQGLLCIGQDITAQKQLQNEQIKAQKLESLSVLAAGIAHNFNNALTGVIGYLSYSRKHLDDKEEIAPLLEAAEKSSNRAAGLARQLLTFAKGGEPFKKVCRPAELVQESMALFLSGSRVKGDFVCSTECMVFVDSGQLAQVFNNIILNALNAMPQGGTLLVRISGRTIEADNVQLIKPGEYVQIEFCDNGCGIAPEHINKVFDPYYTTRANGSGLGLSTCHAIIARHDGHIGISSVYHTGTTVTILLPAVTGRLVSVPSSQQNDAPSSEIETTVLFMDDEEDIRDLAIKRLAESGYRVVTCANGEEVVEQYRNYWQSGKIVPIVILDLLVPGGMGGDEAAREILSLDKSARLIVSSGYSNDLILAEYVKYGFCAALPKPYNAEELLKVLKRVSGK